MNKGTGQEAVREKRVLFNKREELEALKKHLARMERILSRLRVEIGTLKKMYYDILDPRIRELDNLKRHLSESREFQQRKSSSEQSTRHKTCYTTSEKESDDTPIENIYTGVNSHPPDSFKELYRKVAKAIHPDLSTNEEERKTRQMLMAEANNAYSKKDRESLQAILRQWESASRLSADGDIAAEVSLLQHKISWVMKKIRAVETEIAELKSTDLYSLLVKVEEAQYDGVDLLAEMAKQMDADIESARRRLRSADRAQSGPPWCGNGVIDNGRTIRFPSNRPVGTLFVRSSRSDSFLDWRSLGLARGEIFVPENKDLRLDIRNKTQANAEYLGTLGEHDLQALFLHNSSDAELSSLPKLTGLQELYLSGKGITDSGLEYLAELKRLRRLYIYDTSVSDKASDTLRALAGLRCITFCGSGMSEKALQRIKEYLPACSIIILNHRTDANRSAPPANPA